MITVSQTLPKPSATRDDVKFYYETLSKTIAANDRRNSVSTILAILQLNDGNKWLARMRKEGIFRASRYGYTSGCLTKVIESALAIAPSSGITLDQVQYLESVRALLRMAEPAKQIQNSIIAKLKARKKTVLKTLLAIVNSSFAKNLIGNDLSGKDQLQFCSCTDYASAYSRILMIWRDNIGGLTSNWTSTDDVTLPGNESIYTNLLLDALKLNELIDAEVLLDGLPYKATATSTGVLVSAIDPSFERSIRLGYIQTDLQLLARAVSFQQHQTNGRSIVPSFCDAKSNLFESGLLNFVLLKTEPVERFTIALPTFPKLIELLNFDSPFQEEITLFAGAMIDNFHPPENGALKLSEQLTLIDVFKLQRLFNLLDSLLRKKLESVENLRKRYQLDLRSTVMVIRREDLLKMLQIILSLEQADELISLLLLHIENSIPGTDAYIDLQYKPLLQLDSSENYYIAIPPAVLGKSNLIRSIMHASKIKAATAANNDPMQVALASALRGAGFRVQENFELNIHGKRETDIFCYRDGVLLIIECKNAYHPCSPHELRNSYDLILKAEEQLDIRAQWLAKPSNQTLLFSKLGWIITEHIKVLTCIVTANRSFNGYFCGAHPVRQAHEMINVLSRGYIRRGSNEPPFRFWRSEAFEISDLLDYLAGKSIIETQHSAMTAIKRSISLKELNLEFDHFIMNLEDIGPLFDTRKDIEASM